MANLFKSKKQNALSPRAKLDGNYNLARSQILFVIAFSLINAFLSAVNANVYFLFSAFFPYFFVSFGMELCGKYPAEFYEEYYDASKSELDFYGNGVFVFLISLAVLAIIFYFVSWYFSKNHKVGWLIFALIVFLGDTAGLFWLVGISADYIMDYLFHIWVIVYLIIGISSHFKLKKLPPEEAAVPPSSEEESLLGAE